MKALLIHNDNLPDELIDNFSTTEKFDITQTKMMEKGFSFDKYAHEELAKWLKNKNYNVIFLPFSLSDNNYLELTGLRLGLHIRLTKEINHADTPIVFLGYETPEQITRLTYLGNFLFTSGVFCTDKFNNLSDLHKQYSWISSKWRPKNNKLSEEDYKEVISRIYVEPPANYTFHHSIANEWALIRWAEALEVKAEGIHKLNIELESSLYFKYLKAKHPISTNIAQNDYAILRRGRMLFVDDEIEKGWGEVFKKICDGFPASDLEFVGKEFKTKSNKEEVVEEVKDRIRAFNPDVIILDLRLHDQDFRLAISGMTGFKILQWVKGYYDNDNKKVVSGYNPGIQVVIVSASNKTWNLQALQEAGADGFINKESPENSVDDDFTTKSLKNICKTIDDCLFRKFLKDFQPLRKSTFSLASDTSSKLEIVFELLRKVRPENCVTNFRHAYLLLYQILENFVKSDKVYKTYDVKSEIKHKSVVVKLDNSEVEVYSPCDMIPGNIRTNITLKRDGRFFFQTSMSEKTITAATFNVDTFKKDGFNAKSQTKETPLFKIINVFKERYSYTEEECDQIIMATYLRSNLCGHVTGNIDPSKREISSDDILCLIEHISKTKD
ncbi:MAG: response regulator [Bacteroidetes bacterium]|nr:response regulator [Bacteroidota bacterium]